MDIHTKRRLHIYLFPAVFLYFEIILRLCTKTPLFSHLFYPIIFSIAAGFLCSCLTTLFQRKTNRIISIVLLFFVGLLFIIECLIRNSFQLYMSFGTVLSGAGGVIGGFGGELIKSILFGIPVILLFFLPGIAYTVYGKKRIPSYRHKPPFIRKVFLYSLTAFIIGSLTASIGSSREKYKTNYEFNTATQYFGLLTGMRLDLKQAVFGGSQKNSFDVEPANTDVASKKPKEKDNEKEKEKAEKKDLGDNVSDLDFAALASSEKDETIAGMHTYVNSLTPSNKNDYTGLFKGKNLILICAEAFSDLVINEELTPTLYRMTHNGFYFSDYYQPSWGGSTSTGEYSFLVGLAPQHSVNTLMDIRENNVCYTLGNQLQKQGYSSFAYHDGEYDFYNRDQTHTNLGYDQFLGLGNGLEDITGQWPGDKRMFDKTMDTYIDKQPFSIYYMTVSGHCSYKEKNEKTEENLDAVKKVFKDRYKDTTNYYFCYQLELEHALTVMIEKLEEAGIADDTVICMTADHYPYGLEKSATFGNTEDYVADLYGADPKTDWERDHNSLIIWSGSLENKDKKMAREIKTPTYSLDVVPTLSNLFGLEYDSRLLVGRDVFSDAEPLVFWNNHSWMTDKGKYDANENKFYPNEGVDNDKAYINQINSAVSNKINYSDQVVKKDYYGVLFGKK